MSFDKTQNDDLTEKIKILATDDEKIKSFGELFTNDSSREILQLLFNEELTANQISQKTGISLQLVKYHLIKLQDLGIVKITKIEKNSKSQDMKVYTATKFSIVIVPPKLSEKTKESKMLVRSFKHIYKVAGFAIATGISGLLSLTQLQSPKISTELIADTQLESIDEDVIQSEMRKSFSGDTVTESIPSSTPKVEQQNFDIVESQELSQSTIHIEDSIANPEISSYNGSDFFLPLVVITLVFAGITIYYLWKFKKSKKLI